MGAKQVKTTYSHTGEELVYDWYTKQSYKRKIYYIKIETDRVAIQSSSIHIMGLWVERASGTQAIYNCDSDTRRDTIDPVPFTHTNQTLF